MSKEKITENILSKLEKHGDYQPLKIVTTEEVDVFGKEFVQLNLYIDPAIIPELDMERLYDMAEEAHYLFEKAFEKKVLGKINKGEEVSVPFQWGIDELPFIAKNESSKLLNLGREWME